MIGVIVINYHSEEKTIEFVRTELAKIRSDYAVVIVDNGSTELSRDRLLEAFKGRTSMSSWCRPKRILALPKAIILGRKWLVISLLLMFFCSPTMTYVL